MFFLMLAVTVWFFAALAVDAGFAREYGAPYPLHRVNVIAAGATCLFVGSIIILRSL